MSTTEAAWVSKERSKVLGYLSRNINGYDRLSDWPVFHLEPYFAIWSITTTSHPTTVGFWAFSGDIATDVITRDGTDPADNPRKALVRMLEQWASYIPQLELGENPPGIAFHGGPEKLKALVEPFRRHLETLSQWAEDDDLWDVDCPLDPERDDIGGRISQQPMSQL